MKLQKKELKDLNLLDRFLFAEAIENSENMELILEIILGKDIILKHLPQAEKEQRSFLWSRQVKLDVWAQDSDGSIYDTEVQQQDTKDLPKRSRFYNSMIDSKLLFPGGRSYNELNDVYIIIITPFDLFGKGLYKYTFDMACEEVPEVRLRDGVTRIFLNTRGTREEGVSKELIELLRYFEKSTAALAERSESERILRLHENIARIKASEEVGVKFMNAWEENLLFKQEGYEEGREEGIRSGKNLEKKELSLKMKEKGMSEEDIADITGLSVEDIRKL